MGASPVVAWACPVAAGRGVRPGITLSQARALAPDLAVLGHDPLRDRLALRRLARWAVRLSPIVEPREPDTLLVDITGCAPLFGGERRLAHQALAGLAALGFRARAAIADTVGAAYALAVSRLRTFSAASAEPDALDAALHIVPPGETVAHLAPLAPATLRIDPEVVARLDALGVRTIGDLLALPRAALPARFGAGLVRRLQEALGETAEPVATHPPDRVPAARVRFEGPVADRAVLAAALDRLLAEVLERVVRAGGALRRLDCVLYYERCPPQVVTVELARAVRAAERVRPLLAQRLETVGPVADEGVIGAALVARQTSRWRGTQGELFDPRPPDDDEALAALLDRLAARLGSEAVLRPQLVDDHQPEWAYRYVTVAEAGCEVRGEEGAPTAAAQPGVAVATAPRGTAPRCGPGPAASPVPSLQSVVAPITLSLSAGPPGRPAFPTGRHAAPSFSGPAVRPRPVRLLPRPVPLRVLALVPDGPPTWLALAGREYAVAQAEGPERIETAWWRGPDVRRDYFRVTTTDGRRLWVFRARTDGRWYLHGVFA